MRIPQVIVAALIICGLVILVLQNMSPSLALAFLGARSVMLPLGVWLSAAIALGVLTTLVIWTLTGGYPGGASPRKRRRWTVRPDAPQDGARSQDTDRRSEAAGSWSGRSSTPPPRNPPRAESGRSDPPSTSVSGRRASPPPSPSAAAEDWQTWQQRSSPEQWDDWSQATGNDPIDENLSRRQRKERQRAESTLQDLDQGWDETAQETVYVAPGGSDVEDTLDEISEGWDDWESEADPAADTAYSHQYEGNEKSIRRDAVYGPADDATGEYEDWRRQFVGEDGDADEDGDDSDDSVYDADYRVIIPPHRSLDDENDDTEGDRAP